MAAAPSIVNITGPQDLAIYADPEETCWMNDIVSFTNFAYLPVKIQAVAGTKYAPTKSFSAHGYADLLSTVYIEFMVPAIAPNGAATDCYLVNSFGFAAIDTFTFKIGTSAAEVKYGRWMEAIIELTEAPGSRFEDLVGTFESETQLIQASASDNRYLVPILISQTRWLHNAVPALALHHSTITYEVKLFTLDLLTVNVGAPTLVPYKFGTTTALQNSDIDVNLYVTGIILDDCERSLFICSDLAYVITQVQEYTLPITATGQFKAPLNWNHPLKYGMWFLQRAESIDGSTFTRDKVGLKDRFDYSSNHGGESLSDMKWTINQQQIWNSDDLPPVFLRVIRAKEAFPYNSKRCIYIWNFGPDCDKWNPVQTVNFSRIDNSQFEAKNNNIATPSPNPRGIVGFTTGIFYKYVENINKEVIYGGIGGVPFTA